MIDRVADFINWLSDADWGWWPFLNWRPKPKERFTYRLSLKLAVYGASLWAVIFACLVIIFCRRIWWPNFWGDICLLYPIAFLFVISTFSWAWNRRASRLQQTPSSKRKIRKTH